MAIELGAQGRVGGGDGAPAALAAARRRLGGPLLGDDLGLELGGAGQLLGVSGRRRGAGAGATVGLVAAVPAGFALPGAALQSGALAGSVVLPRARFAMIGEGPPGVAR